MKKYTIILMLMCNYMYAQNSYFSDTLNTDNREVAGIGVYPTQNNGYAILYNDYGLSQFSVAFANQFGEQTHRKTWVIDSTKFFFLQLGNF